MTDPVRPPSRADLAKAALQVFAANLASPFSDRKADQWAEQAMAEYGRKGGDISEHATLFGLAGAGGAVTSNAGITAVGGAAANGALKGLRGAKAMQAILKAPAGGAVPVGLSPLEYLPDAIAHAPAVAEAIPAVGRVVGSIRPVASKFAGRIAAGGAGAAALERPKRSTR